MIEIKIPKELDHYEAKLIGPFTARQSICLLCAIPAVIAIFNLCKPYLGKDVAGFVCFIPAIIAFLFGWYKPYGMKFEVFLRSVFVTTVLAPSKRKYKTENFYKKLMAQDIEEEDDDFFNGEKSTKKKKKVSSGANNYRPSEKAIF